MNCVDFAINEVLNADIDEYLLKLAFENPNSGFTGNWYNMVNATTVPQAIREKVIHQMVLPRCNVMGGKTEFIDLSGALIRDLGNGVVEVNVPDVLTGGRHIISVEQIYLGTMNSAVGAVSMGVNSDSMCGQGTMNEMMTSFIDSVSGNRSMPPVYTNIHMTGTNSFVIVGASSGTFTMTAKCLMEYDQGLSSIHPKGFTVFSEAVLLAVKAYIFRTCRRPAQEAVVRSGVAIDDIKDDIADYRDSFQQFKEFFDTKWTKTMTYSDKQKVQENIFMTTPSRI